MNIYLKSKSYIICTSIIAIRYVQYSCQELNNFAQTPFVHIISRKTCHNSWLLILIAFYSSFTPHRFSTEVVKIKAIFSTKWGVYEEASLFFVKVHFASSLVVLNRLCKESRFNDRMFEWQFLITCLPCNYILQLLVAKNDNWHDS